MFRKVRIVDPKSGKIVSRLDNPGKLGQIAWSPDGTKVAIVSALDQHDPRRRKALGCPMPRAAVGKTCSPISKAMCNRSPGRDNDSIVYQAAKGVWTVVGQIQADGRGGKEIIPVGQCDSQRVDRFPAMARPRLASATRLSTPAKFFYYFWTKRRRN
ncbi:MAG: hypothetical protein KatS3mg105_4352 [Gemmatales bacterium]|nr:MAG: hypothetical protein KatS3mg105_4352 [Gemmatales bacterium]